MWKTGTSWGFRDAWTAGIFGSYVLVVWVGNFDGSSNPAFVGVQAAAPLFFRIVDAIGATRKLVEPAYRQPPRLEHVDVCSASGDLPNAECPQTTSTWYIPGVSPIRVSQVHRRVWIDTRTGTQACPPYDPQYTRSEVFEYWPTELLQLFAQSFSQNGADMVSSIGGKAAILSTFLAQTKQNVDGYRQALESTLVSGDSNQRMVAAIALAAVLTALVFYLFLDRKVAGPESSSNSELIA